MTVQKAIEKIKWTMQSKSHNKEFCEYCIQALEEVEQYRALGTVEELKEAKEKQIPKKCEIYTALQPRIDFDNEVDVYECPNCGTHIGVADENNQFPYCWNCGQKLDWEEGAE